MKYYLDCEFDGFKGPLMSMGLVREDGFSLYLTTEWVGHGVPIDKWVTENVRPVLYDCSADITITNVVMQEVGGEIWNFLRRDKTPVVIVTDWPADVRYFCEAIEYPYGNMIPIYPGIAFEIVRVDAYPSTLEGAIQHNAWWDAMALRRKMQGPDVKQFKLGL